MDLKEWVIRLALNLGMKKTPYPTFEGAKLYLDDLAALLPAKRDKKLGVRPEYEPFLCNPDCKGGNDYYEKLLVIRAEERRKRLRE
jgi:hypothetical protein